MSTRQAKVDSRRKFITRATQASVLAAAAGATASTAAGAPQKKKVITSDRAALPVGPYSQGIRAGNFIFVAGEKGLDPSTGEIVPGGIAAETRQAMENIKAILEEEGASLDDAVSSVVYLTDINDFSAMNEVYGEYFGDAPPGRTTVGVNALPAGARVEITITALGPTA